MTSSPSANPALDRIVVDDVTTAVSRLRQVQRGWAAVPVDERADLLLRLHDVVLTRSAEILDTIQTDVGKSRADAFEEVADSCLVARHYGRRGAAYLRPTRARGLIPGLIGSRTTRYPHGVVGVVAPWNYPLILTLGEVLPALVAGNGVLVKPDPQAEATARLGVDLLVQAGMPAGLVEVVTGGAQAGQAVVEAVDHVVFTGSTAAGRAVATRAGARLIGAALELGGKNTMIVRHDADLRLAVAGAVRGAFANAGQVCLAPERIAVHAEVYEQFLDRFTARVRAIRLGAGLDFGYDMGRLANQAQFDKLVDHLADAHRRGATVVAGGRARPDLGPLFHEPTVLTDLPVEARCYAEETFGPLVSVFRVPDDDAAVALANDTDAGLTASIWTRDQRRARQLAARLEVGSVSVNDPFMAIWGSTAAAFGGVKDSGNGRRHGATGITALTRTQTVAVQRGARVGVGMPTLLDQPAPRWTGGFALALAALRRSGLS